MPSGFDQNDVHNPYASGNHWTNDRSTTPTDQFIEWSFNTPEDLSAIYIWNHQSTTPPANHSGYDVTSFDLILIDASDNVLLNFDNLSLSPDSNMAQTFSFGGTVQDVSKVRFEIEAVQNSTNFTGLAEVGFESVGVVSTPEPSTILGLVAISGLALGASKRNKNSIKQN
ncbi:MAG: PEP-CTERM sorting domain-containing protein [Cyanobacteriota bacterium]|nr:PEP-CTERM sorting domain-containing protein [Cyanobacteriota bacterium]